MVFLLDTLSNDLFGEHQWKDLWGNNRFQYLVKEKLDDPVIASKLCEIMHQKNFKNYLPRDISEILGWPVSPCHYSDYSPF
jgi:hypothetical protein